MTIKIIFFHVIKIMQYLTIFKIFISPVQRRGILPLRGQQRGQDGGHGDARDQQERATEAPASLHEAASPRRARFVTS